MPRVIFIWSSILSLLIIGIVAHFFWVHALFFLIIVIPLIALGIYDLQTTHNVLRIYPVIGHLRYMFEFIRPEIQQYFIATNLSGRPYSREQRSLVYQRAKNEVDTHPFGTEHDLDENGYQYTLHSIRPKEVPESAGRIMVGGPQCLRPYDASRLNISGMSFGAISTNAVLAMNLGAKLGNFMQGTGEGGLTEYHLRHGGDIMLQVASGYFGMRNLEGDFDEQKYTEKARLDCIKMIEIKLSQGAKPGHGGVLPAAKITPEIAKIRGIRMGVDCVSPPSHKTFSTPEGLLQFLAKIRELSGGKPTGIKLCVGKRSEFMGICKAMLKTGIYPDFITVDGAEGGTGAAPLELTNRFGTPVNEGVAFVHNCLTGINVRDHIRVIASGKIVTGFDIIAKIALGADMCNAARTMMFAVGCIQALRCNTNTCPTGVTTQDPRRVQALVPEHKSLHVKNYHDNTIKSFLALTGSMGVDHPDKLKPDMIYHRFSEGESITFYDMFHFIDEGNFLGEQIHPAYKDDWKKASAEQF